MATYVEKVTADGATHLWKLDETSGTNADDAIGSKDGTYTGSSYTLAVDGPAVISGSKAFRVPASDDGYVAFTDGSGLPTGNNDRTIEAWIKTSRTGAATIFGYGTVANNEQFVVLLNEVTNQRLGVDYYTYSNDVTSTVNDGDWHHVAVTYDGTTGNGTAEFFVDGTSLGTASHGTEAATGSTGARIGALYYYGGFYLGGDICMVAVYDSVLSGSAIADHAVGDDAGVTVTAVSVAAPITLPAPEVSVARLTVDAVPVSVPVTIPVPVLAFGALPVVAVSVPVSIPVPTLVLGPGLVVDAVSVEVAVTLPVPAVGVVLPTYAPPLTIAVVLPTPAVTIAGVVPPPPPVTITIDGISSPIVRFESLSITEALAYPGPQPTTASFTIEDVDGTVTVKKLADVTIDDGSETLFRGQVTRIRRRPIASRRTIAVECISYDRYAAASPVGLPRGGGGSYSPPDLTTATIEYDDQASTAYLYGAPIPDKAVFGHMVDRYFLGPDTDYATHVAYTVSLPGDYYWPDTTLDVVLSDLCALVSPDWVWFLRPDLAWHFGPLSANHAPADFSDDPDNVSTFATHDLVTDEDMSSIAGSAYVRGTLPAGSGWINPNPYLDADVVYAPAITVSAPSRNAAEAGAYSRGELARRGTSLVTLSFYTIGTSGWHRGQTVRVTNAALGLSAVEYVVRSVKLSMLDAHSVRRYDLEVGDRPSLSLAYEIRAQRRTAPVPTVKYGKTTDPASRFNVETMWGGINVVPDGGNDTLVAQLATSTREPLRAAGVRVNWQVWRDDVQLTSNSGAGNPDGSDGAYLAAAVTETDFTGRAYNNWYMVDRAGRTFDVTVYTDAV